MSRASFRLSLQGAGGLLGCALLWLAVIASALGVVQSTFKERQLFAELQLLKKEVVQEKTMWGRYLLEQSTWASFERVSELAETELNMRRPGVEDTLVVSFK